MATASENCFPPMRRSEVTRCLQHAYARTAARAEQLKAEGVKYPNLGEILGLIEFSRAPGSQLMQVVYAALADGHAHNVAQEFHHTTVGAAANEREGQADLTQPGFGDWKIEQNLIVCGAWRKGVVERLKRPILLLVDELSTDVVLGPGD